MGNFANKTFIGELEITKEMRYKDLLCTLISEDFLNNKTYKFKYPIEATIINNKIYFSDDYDLRHKTEEIVKLNDVYGRGTIYKKFNFFGIDMYIDIGYYNLRENTENILYSDEEVELMILTYPNIEDRLANIR